MTKKPAKEQRKTGIAGFDNDLDTRRASKGVVELWFEKHPEVLEKVRVRIETLRADPTAPTATQIFTALETNFDVPFSDHSFRRWVKEHFGSEVIRCNRS